MAMKCVNCKSPDVIVIDTRDVDKNNAVRRRRVCKSCGVRFSTYEISDDIYIELLRRSVIYEDFVKWKEKVPDTL